MGQAVTRETLGAWLLKANPGVWDVRRFLADGHRSITSWSVQHGYRSALVRPGDKVVFWLSGPGKGGLVRGVWGLGHVVAQAEAWQDAEPGWWLDDAARQALRARRGGRAAARRTGTRCRTAGGGDHRPRGAAGPADVEPVLGLAHPAGRARRPASRLAGAARDVIQRPVVHASQQASPRLDASRCRRPTRRRG